MSKYCIFTKKSYFIWGIIDTKKWSNCRWKVRTFTTFTRWYFKCSLKWSSWWYECTSDHACRRSNLQSESLTRRTRNSLCIQESIESWRKCYAYCASCSRLEIRSLGRKCSELRCYKSSYCNDGNSRSLYQSGLYRDS